VLRSLYPEDPAVCHQVLVHPPGGIVGGDTLRLDVRLDAGAHALLTTPGATRFYRSGGATARQSLDARCGPDSRLEWLPLETLVHDGARAVNALRFELDAGAETIGWDLLGLGLPASGEAYLRGRFEQRVEVFAPSGRAWLERACSTSTTRATRSARGACSPARSAGTAARCSARCGSPPARRSRSGAASACCESARAALPEALAGGATAPESERRRRARPRPPRRAAGRGPGAWRGWRRRLATGGARRVGGPRRRPHGSGAGQLYRRTSTRPAPLPSPSWHARRRRPAALAVARRALSVRDCCAA
jgi:urease accessory protein